MKLAEIQALAQELIVKHLPDALFEDTSEWGFAWNDRIDALGLCSYRKKMIYLSKRWTRNLPQEEVLDTILHEIAHALAGSKAAHGPEWQRIAVSIGAKPETTLRDIGVYREDIATPTHHMVDTTTGKILRKYYRRPSAKVFLNISTYYARGRRQETIGKVVIRKVPLIDKL